jgi:RimJ/RimL family protein N-acetyltransferase
MLDILEIARLSRVEARRRAVGCEKEESMTAIAIRAARAEDIDGLAALDAWGWPEGAQPYRAHSAPFSTRYSLADLTAALDGPRHIGFVALSPRTRLAANSHVGLVRSILVAPDFRGAGLARALLAAAESRAATRGFLKIDAHVLASNPVSLALFAKAGFAEEGRLRGEFRLREKLVDDVHLGKWLPEEAFGDARCSRAAGASL